MYKVDHPQTMPISMHPDKKSNKNMRWNQNKLTCYVSSFIIRFDSYEKNLLLITVSFY